MWLPNNLVGFNNANKSYFKQNNNLMTEICVVDISREVDTLEHPHEAGVNDVTIRDADKENSIDLTRTTERCGDQEENKIGTRNIWSSNETLGLIVAIEAGVTTCIMSTKEKLFGQLYVKNLEVKTLK